MNSVAVFPVIGAIVTGALIVPVIAVGSAAVDEYGYMPAATNSNWYTSPAPFGPESNKGVRAGPSPMESVAVCELGPRKSHCTTLPVVTWRFFGLNEKSAL